MVLQLLIIGGGHWGRCTCDAPLPVVYGLPLRGGQQPHSLIEREVRECQLAGCLAHALDALVQVLLVAHMLRPSFPQLLLRNPLVGSGLCDAAGDRVLLGGLLRGIGELGAPRGGQIAELPAEAIRESLVVLEDIH